jgi:cytochrome c oxidase assembly protein subunit 15
LKTGQSQHFWVHLVALLTALMTFPLLFVGGLVTSTGSALAVPDWPTTFGHNMFLFPWSGMVGGILYEHSHRLLGALVGLLTIILSLGLWLRDTRPWLRWLGTVALVGVILQGVLGGLRVILLQHALAIVHACFAQAFFALLVGIAFFTAPQHNPSPTEPEAPDLGRLRGVCVVTTALIYVQVVFGAILRHTGTRLDAHLLIAGLVALHILALNMSVWRHHVEQSALVRPVMLLSALLMVQLSLGLGAYLVRFTALASTFTPFARIGLTTTHLAVGSLMLATSLVLTLRTYHLGAAPRPDLARTVLSQQVSL